MSIVFVAGPLSGLFVQPLIGALADHSTSSWGRRRPYMISGSVLCAIAVLLLGFTKDVSSWFLPRDSDAVSIEYWIKVYGRVDVNRILVLIPVLVHTYHCHITPSPASICIMANLNSSYFSFRMPHWPYGWLYLLSTVSTFQLMRVCINIWLVLLLSFGIGCWQSYSSSGGSSVTSWYPSYITARARKCVGW